MRYQLDPNLLKKFISQRGYANLTEFARAHGFNRSTLHHYIKGQGGPFPESYYAICKALEADPISLLSPISDDSTDNLAEIMPIVKKLCSIDNRIAILLIGSRARKKHRRYSDWDIGVTRGQHPLGGVEFLRLKRNVDEEVDRLPREVDFVNLDAAPDWFLHGIDYEPLLIAGDSNSRAYFMGVLHGTKRRKEIPPGSH